MSMSASRTDSQKDELIVHSAKNYTIDDSQWATPALHLSPGWNMLRINGSDQYIDPPDVEHVRPLLGDFWNSSLSWTSRAGSNTTIFFIGTDIWAYGIASVDHGWYEAKLDGVRVDSFTAYSQTTDYHRLLFAAHGLEDGPRHNLTLTNAEEGQALAFDVAVIKSAAAFASPLNASTSISSAPSTTSDPLSDLPTGATSQYSAAQLASLEEIYDFHWNSAAYFVVVFSGMVVAAFTIVVLYILMRACAIRRREGDVAPTGESYLIDGDGLSKPRPTSRVLDALRGKKISSPMPSDEPPSDTHTRNSGGSGGSHGAEQDYDGTHGW